MFCMCGMQLYPLPPQFIPKKRILKSLIIEVSDAGKKRRMGFGKRGKTSFTVHRSEEVIPGDVKLSKQGSSASSEGDLSTDGDRFDDLSYY